VLIRPIIPFICTPRNRIRWYSVAVCGILFIDAVVWSGREFSADHSGIHLPGDSVTTTTYSLGHCVVNSTIALIPYYLRTHYHRPFRVVAFVNCSCSVCYIPFVLIHLFIDARLRTRRAHAAARAVFGLLLTPPFLFSILCSLFDPTCSFDACFLDLFIVRYYSSVDSLPVCTPHPTCSLTTFGVRGRRATRHCCLCWAVTLE